MLASVLCRVLGGRWGTCRGLAEKVQQRARLNVFLAESRGSVAIIFGLTMFVLFLMIGLAVDYARFVNARSQTIEATDAAVLAGARALQTNGGDQSAAVKVAETYYQQATKNRIPVLDQSDSIDFVVTDNGTAMETTGNARVATPFMHLAFLGSDHMQSLPLLHSDGTDYSKAVLAVGGNGQTNLEVSLMLDISGSMGQGTKLQDMKDAANDLVDIVVWQDQSEYTSRIAVVPFSADVYPTSDLFKAATGQDQTSKPSYIKLSGTKYYPTPCVAERPNKNYTDDAPGKNKYVLREFDTRPSRTNAPSGTAPCGIDTSGMIVPMTSDKSTLHDKINSLVDGGNTAGHVGTAWAYYLLSPNWAPYLPSASKPVAYGTAKTKKIAVLMTDGAYNQEHDSNGVSTGDSGAGSSVNGTDSASQAKSVCTDMKKNGVEVYTVGFDLAGNSKQDQKTALDTLSNCATDTDHFYNSSTGDALKAAFRDIALKISSLYLSQ
ncbi:MAG: TadE/TadG family protein [Proteobacteria bacterium]|nr:TadE/TadG family protein [Pseudomonadota bacterium]